MLIRTTALVLGGLWVAVGVCACSGSDQAAGVRTVQQRLWQVQAPAEILTQRDAAEYCDELALKGFEDWRLPTITELRALIVGCPGREAGGSCKVADPDCLTQDCYTRTDCGHCPEKKGPADGCYWEPDIWGGSCTDTWFTWTSSLFDDTTDHFWVVRFQGGGLFDDGVVGFNEELGEGSVRCVR